MDSLTYLNQWLPAVPRNNFAGASGSELPDAVPTLWQSVELPA